MTTRNGGFDEAEAQGVGGGGKLGDGEAGAEVDVIAQEKRRRGLVDRQEAGLFQGAVVVHQQAAAGDHQDGDRRVVFDAHVARPGQADAALGQPGRGNLDEPAVHGGDGVEVVLDAVDIRRLVDLALVDLGLAGFGLAGLGLGEDSRGGQDNGAGNAGDKKYKKMADFAEAFSFIFL